ncbi:LEAF RUST 10 DISEASE-RESISTANCE LOCUS RECEPTOR-LIKE PROTEIN KINASE-like 1.2 isoform X2 [Apium graveolens]|uniref:LEAF RUST 10 DISEASE-RESISTANCE LOCUS RECEPTOR-LIKE PROTEIN KINASE-like 1.2 isoform X2 n=1 Tax=Apium graveolens TaxID=4045 RepID=UPI003D7931A4
MNLPFFSSKIFIFMIPLITFSALQKGHAKDFEQHSKCLETKFECGQDFVEMSYPFWGNNRPSYCGLEGFELTCDNEKGYSTITIDSFTFRVLNINESDHEIWITSTALEDDTSICPPVLGSTFLNRTRFGSNPKSELIYVYYACPDGLDVNLPGSLIWDDFNCLRKGVPSKGYYVAESFSEAQSQVFEQCKIQLVAPVLRKAFEEYRNNESMSLVEVLKQGFTLDYIIDEVACSACVNSSGFCGSVDVDAKRFQCLCRDGAYPVSCPKREHKMRVGVKVGIALGALALGVALTALAFCFYMRRKKVEYGSSLISRNISSFQGSISDSEKGGTCMGVPIFSYADLEKATNNFDSSREVGDGGFGSVYKGKLQDGRVVAVKRLYENNFKRVEQFMNEIEILTRLRHKNLVPLYGCTSQHCRQLLLVYEYVPNGTIADHLYGNRAKPGKLTWKTRIKIATETASALSYLHASDVIHRDVKTTNILLDNSFSVKVADFGLSRLFPLDATHVSTAPQGTPGYVDPEYHECYQLTDKSDVYSFGVVLIELISSMPAVDISRHRHEINLSNMAMNKIQNGALQELVDPNLGFEADSDIRNMITLVAELAFQCLQNGREFRPTMKKVYEVLLGIQSKYYGNVKVDLLGDDSLSLKDDSQILSPNSVTANWESRSTTASSTT